MELGIGIWNGPTARYYAMPTVEAQGRAILDTLEGRGVLVYYDPTSYALIAHYTTADRVWWEDDVLRLSTGERIENGLLFNEEGDRVEAEFALLDVVEDEPEPAAELAVVEIESASVRVVARADGPGQRGSR